MSKAVYRDYDQEAMEYQYGPRVAVQGVDAILARWVERSNAYYAASDCERDVAYGPGDAETLDVFRPGKDNAPVLIFIHGGYWRALDKSDHAFLVEPFVNAGALVFSINYALCPSVTIDEITRQTRAACAWVWRNAASYGGDPERVHVYGHSAGGHLTAMMAATDWPAFEAGLPTDMLKSATPISGLFDLAPILLISVNNDVHLDEAAVARLSPAKLAPGHDVAMTIAAGGAETDEFRRQSRILHEAWGGTLSRAEHVESDGKNHFTVMESMTEPGNGLTRRILGHMGL